MSALERDLDVDVTLADDINPDEMVYDHETKQLRPFVVHDLASAEWAMRKIAQKRARLAEAEAYVQAETDRLQLWLDGYRSDAAHAEDFFGPMLQQWHRLELEADHRRKTISLPSGELKARKAPDRVVVADEDAFVCAHGFDSPLVRVKAAPDLQAIRKVVMDLGEKLEGVEVERGEVRFTVVPSTAPAPVPPPALVPEEVAF